MKAEDTPEQREFDAKYITASEVMRLAGGVAYSTVMHARREGRLPGYIICGNGCVWEREKLKPYLDLFVARMQARNSKQSAYKWDAATNKPVPYQ